VPYRLADPSRHASSTDPGSWAAFEDAVEAYAALDGCVDGIGVVLTSAANITCIDLDHVLDDAGQLDVRAATIVERCDSWTEISPSGNTFPGTFSDVEVAQRG
jgi:primase-polymerase (primpol)-like protein